MNGQAVVMTLLKKPSTETIGIKEFSASCDLCDLCDLCDHIDLVSFSVFFSTLLIPLEIETSDFFSVHKRLGSHWSHGAHVVEMHVSEEFFEIQLLPSETHLRNQQRS